MINAMIKRCSGGTYIFQPTQAQTIRAPYRFCSGSKQMPETHISPPSLLILRIQNYGEKDADYVKSQSGK